MSTDSKKRYAATIHLPKTSFPMKAELARREPELLKQWETEKLYESIRKKSAGKPKYILHDGPPYANGRIHIGHALNKILKDIIVKYYTMRGRDALYVPGWDCHGLPIEHQCLKDMGKRKDEVERVAFRKEARKYAEKFISIQREEFKRLGVFGEWDQPYLTMSYEYQAAIAESFLKLYEKGYIEQRLKPVPWCFDCETALADAELEYEDRTDPAVWVKFPVPAEKLSQKIEIPSQLASKKFYLLIWTTTPWTLPANVGVAVHKDFYYTIAYQDDQAWIIAHSATGTASLDLPKDRKWEVSDIRFKGSVLDGLEYSHPFIERQGKVILADYVTLDTGTGLVHIAPGHGEEDYVYGHLKNGLPIVSPVDEKGRFTKEFDPCTGMNVFKANARIIEILKEKGALLHEEPYQHSYPHCWRCKNPIIFRATPQWFLKIDHNDLRKKMSAAIQSKIKFTPDWGKNRIGSMVETRPDWCLSRQRYWGVPIPIVSCKSCKRFFGCDQAPHLIPPPARAGGGEEGGVVAHFRKKVVEIFQKEGADAWFEKPASAFLPVDFKCACGSKEFKKEEDIIDVWFDSGVSHQAVLKPRSVIASPEGARQSLKYPCDLYLEGSDQHRGWFQSALTTGIALDGASPFEGVLTHGFVVDGEGKKMSKSAGNVVAPQDVMKEFGADILRLWVASCDYQFDVRLSKEILKQLADSYRKIRNTFRYILGNLHDFDPKKDKLSFEKLHPLDQWVIHELERLVIQVFNDYNEFDFHSAFQACYDFCSIDLSSYYFDILKDTLYTAKKDSWLRRSAQSALFEILSQLTRILAPVLSFTMDEVWKSYPALHQGITSVHEAEIMKLPPQSFKLGSGSDHSHPWNVIRRVRDALMVSIEKKRTEGLIGSSLDAKIFLRTEDKKLNEILKQNWKELDRIFIVSQVYEMKDQNGEEVLVDVHNGPQTKLLVCVEKADGQKCERCWHYSVKVGSFAEHPTLCERCVEAI